MIMGWAMAVLVDVVMLPCESVEVTGTRTATGVVGRVLTGAGEGVMTRLSSAESGALDKGFTAGVVVVVGAILDAGKSATGAAGARNIGVVSVGEVSEGVISVEDDV